MGNNPVSNQESNVNHLLDQLNINSAIIFPTAICHGINPYDLASLGRQTLEGMSSCLLNNQNHVQRDEDEREMGEDLITLRAKMAIYLDGILTEDGLKDKPCLPCFRICSNHFKNDHGVRIFQCGIWKIAKVILTERSRGVPENDPFSMMVSVETEGDKPEVLTFYYSDPRILREQEYRYFRECNDWTFLHTWLSNICAYPLMPDILWECNMAAAKLVDPEEDRRFTAKRGELVMVLWRSMWTPAVVYLEEQDNYPAVLELLGGHTQAIAMDERLLFLPYNIWMDMDDKGIIPEPTKFVLEDDELRNQTLV